MSNKRKVLAFHFGALGDFVLSWPALGLLAAGPPAGDLNLVCRRDFGELILPAARVYDRESLELVHLFTDHPDPRLDAWLAGFDLAAVFAQKPAPALLQRLASAKMPQVWAVPTQAPAGQPAHAGDWQVLALRQRGLSAPAPALTVHQGDISPHGRPVLAPGSGGKAKRLPLAVVGGVLEMLADKFGAPILVVGPAEEQDYRRELGWAAAGQGAELVAEPSLKDLAALLAGAGLYVGADSGVTHLAAALGLPTVAAFGPTDPRIWGPRGPRVRLTSPEGLEKALGDAIKAGPDFFQTP